MSRIIAGAGGGLHLASVPGKNTRPTSDRVKEALFSRLESWDVLEGAKVLDLFAGSGGLGVEAASRGAQSVILVEKETKAAAICAQNASTINHVLGSEAVTVRRQSVMQFLDQGALGEWDLVLLDPPYAMTEEQLHGILTAVSSGLKPEAVVVLERSARSPEPSWPELLQGLRAQKYGETQLWFAEHVESE